MWPSNIDSVRWQASADTGIAGARRAHQRGGHRIDDAVLVRLGDRHTRRIGVLRRIKLELLDVAVFNREADAASVFLWLVMVDV